MNEDLISGVTGVRLCIEDRNGVVRKAARIDWAKNDASLYITSYCPPGGKAFAGRTAFVPGCKQHNIEFGGQLEAVAKNPKMSLHQSGRTRTELAKRGTMFVEGQPLFHARGGHIATIKTFNPESLPQDVSKSVDKVPSTLVSPVNDGYSSVRFALRVHVKEEPEKKASVKIKFDRQILSTPLFVSILAVGENEPHPDGAGVVVFGGWGPGIQPHELSEMAFTATTANDFNQPFSFESAS